MFITNTCIDYLSKNSLMNIYDFKSFQGFYALPNQQCLREVNASIPPKYESPRSSDVPVHPSEDDLRSKAPKQPRIHIQMDVLIRSPDILHCIDGS